MEDHVCGVRRDLLHGGDPRISHRDASFILRRAYRIPRMDRIRPPDDDIDRNLGSGFQAIYGNQDRRIEYLSSHRTSCFWIRTQYVVTWNIYSSTSMASSSILPCGVTNTADEYDSILSLWSLFLLEYSKTAPSGRQISEKSLYHFCRNGTGHDQLMNFLCLGSSSRIDQIRLS